jgi:hypothetical protein
MKLGAVQAEKNLRPELESLIMVLDWVFNPMKAASQRRGHGFLKRRAHAV